MSIIIACLLGVHLRNLLLLNSHHHERLPCFSFGDFLRICFCFNVLKKRANECNQNGQFRKEGKMMTVNEKQETDNKETDFKFFHFFFFLFHSIPIACSSFEALRSLYFID
ncbi:hypothetical protein SSS_10060 [Sarcoptes scabiei]|nr:hypothetical protein SSS_10060 [Sarcoptes scabiei]